MKILKNIYIVFGLCQALGQVYAHADSDNGVFSIQVPNCQHQTLSGNKWVLTAPIPVGTKIRGRRHSQSPHILFESGGNTHLVPLSCVEAINDSTPGSSTNLSSYFTLQCALLSWQESLLLLSSALAPYPHQVTSIGISLGLQWVLPLSKVFELGILGRFIYGRSEIGQQSSETDISPVPYGAQGVPLLGFQFAPTLFWSLTSQAAMGISLPLIGRINSWPQPTGGYQLPYSFLMPPGISILGRFGKDFLITPQVGFLGTFSSLYWTLDLGYRF